MTKKRNDSYTRGIFWQLPLFLLAWCVIVEVLIRVFLMSPRNNLDDAVLGWRWTPNSTLLIETVDAGYRRVSFNELGLNDDPIGPKDDRTRLIVLGDSYVEALQVPRRRNFMHLIEDEMPRFQLINAGQAGLDPASELVVSDRLDHELSPDGVILVINYGDETDLLTDKIEVSRCPGSREVCDYRRPTHSVGAARSLLQSIMARSALLTFIVRKYDEPITEVLARLRNVVSPRNIIPDIPRGWENLDPADVESLLKLVFRKIKNRSPLLIMFIPKLEFTVDRQTRIASSENFAVQIARAADDVGAGFVDARYALSEAYVRYGQPPIGFDFNVVGAGHLNELGHRALANVVESKLASFPGGRSRP